MTQSEVELKCCGGKAGKTYQFYAQLYLEMSAAQFAKEILPFCRSEADDMVDTFYGEHSTVV